MPVVINEFEVVDDSPQRSQAAPAPADRPAGKQPDVELVLAQRRARVERVRDRKSVV